MRKMKKTIPLQLGLMDVFSYTPFETESAHADYEGMF